MLYLLYIINWINQYKLYPSKYVLCPFLSNSLSFVAFSSNLASSEGIASMVDRVTNKSRIGVRRSILEFVFESEPFFVFLGKNGLRFSDISFV